MRLWTDTRLIEPPPSPAPPNPRNQGADAKRMRRRAPINANPLQELPIAVLSVFNGFVQTSKYVTPKLGKSDLQQSA